ncbi:hypothetical protein OIU78_001698 [Salix suchowensis]|nr:hypothetical protein OIU78_001698 [Salix suchowensis]
MATSAAKNKNPTHTKPQMSSWADRVKVTDASTRFTLEPIPRCEQGSMPEITQDMLTENAEQWQRCMVGFFPGFRMNFHTVNSVANRVWKSGGLESVMSTATGFWLFRFQTEDQILWSRKGLSVAASVVGKPLSCDEPTFCCTRLDFARVCVEIDAAKPLVYKYDLASPCPNEPLHIEVEYEWKPARCDKCKLFGHACKELDGKDMEAESRPPVVNNSQNDNQLQVTSMKPTSSRAREAKEANLEIASKASVPSREGKGKLEMTQEDSQHNRDDARVRKGKAVAEDLCKVGTTGSLLSHSQSTHEEVEGSETNNAGTYSDEPSETSPMAFIKVRKKKGDKKHKEAYRL